MFSYFQGQPTSTLKIPLEQIGYLQDDYQPAGYEGRKSTKKPAASYNGGGATKEEEDDEEERVEPGFDEDEYDDDQGNGFDCEWMRSSH